MKLTSLEKTALKDLWKSSRGNGHDFGFPDDLPNVEKASRGGVVASLSNKGLIDFEDNSRERMDNLFYFTAKGRELFSDFRESGELKLI